MNTNAIAILYKLRSCAQPLLCAIAIIAVSVALFAAPVLAQSVETLVSNTGQTSTTRSGSNQAQPFTTGSNAAGYGLTSVGIELEDVVSGSTITVQIMPNSAGNEPDESDPAKVITLTNPATLTENSVNVFTAPTDTTLEPDTTYHVVATKPDSQSTNNIRFARTTATAEDSGEAANWSIGNQRLWRNLLTQPWSTSTSTLLKIEIKGTIQSDSTAPSLSTATVGGTRIELTYNEALDETSVPGTSAFSVAVAGSAATVSSVAISGSTVTLRLGATVTSGQTVTVSYTVPTGASATPIQDAAGNDAAALTNQSVTYDAALACEALLCATLTVGVDPGDNALRGFSQSQSAGSLSPRTFTTHEGNSVTLNGLYTYGIFDPYFTIEWSGDIGDDPLELQIGDTSITLQNLSGSLRFEELDPSPFGRFSTGDSLAVTLSAVEPEELSNDATLSSVDIDIRVDEDVSNLTLTPAFDPDVTQYTASVARFWWAVQVASLTTTETSATTVLILPDGTQVESFLVTEEIRLVLNEITTFSIMVTAPDGMTTKTYTFAIGRGAIGQDAPVNLYEGDPLVSNIRQSTGLLNNDAYRQHAQAFTTGDHAAGYLLTRVGIELRQATSATILSVQIMPGKSSGIPDATDRSKIITLGPMADRDEENPSLLTAHSVNYFWAPAGTTLKPNTTYFVVTRRTDDIATQSLGHAVTTSANEDSGKASGWSIGNSRFRRNSIDDSWVEQSNNNLKIQVIGTTIDPAATGQPEISGVTRIGETLTAKIGTIADHNGLPESFPGDYTLQWVRVDGTTETDISGATSGTYTLVSADVGKQIKLEVSFTDRRGNAEGPLVSTVSPEVAGRLNDCTGAQANADWCTTMTVGSRAGNSGFDRRTPDLTRTPFGDLEDRTINVNCSTYAVEAIVTSGLFLTLETNRALPAGSRLFVDGTSYRYNNAQIGTTSNSRDRRTLKWRNSTALTWSDSAELTVALYVPSSAKSTKYCTPSVVGISNLDESQDAAREVAALYHLSQAFTTGSDARGYSFQGVGLVSAWNSGAIGLRVVIREARSDGRPGDVRYVLRNPGAMGAGKVSRFKAPVNAFLEPDTTYMVAIEPIYMENGTQMNGPQRDPHVINWSFMFTESNNALARDAWSYGRLDQRGDSETVEWNGFAPWSEAEFGGWYQRMQSDRTLLMSVYAEPFEPTGLDPWPTVNDEEATEGVDEYLRFNVYLTEAQTTALTFKYATSNGTAKAGSDFAATSGTLTVFAFRCSTATNVQIHDDGVEDDGETMTFTLRDIYGSVLVTATGTIRNEESIDNPLTATFESLPDSHSGDSFTFTLSFSEDVPDLSAATLRNHAFSVSNGKVTGAKQLDPDGDEPSKTWQITVEPHADGPVTLSLPETRDCQDSSAICTDEKPLSAPVSATIAGPAVWSATLTTGIVYYDYGYIDVQGAQRGSLTSKTFEIEGESYAVKLIEAWDRIYIGFDKEIPVDFTLTVDGTELASTDATHTSYSYAEVYTWSGQDIYWNDGDEVELALYVESDDPEPSNEPATGAPTISGTAQVGQTLTAGTAGIADADGLTNVSYTYQWVRDDADISGATSSTYTLTDDDQGKTIKVTASFTDDAGNGESLTSAATASVAARPNRAATGAPTISGTAQVGQTLTADTSGIADADGLDAVSYSYQWIRDDAEITDATSSTYTLTDDDQGKTIKVSVSFTDDEGSDESLTSAATGSVAARPNSAATGAPTISGTAQVGQTLTADTSAIADADGLDDVSYSYQWIANNGTSDTEITDATGSTFFVLAAYEDQTIKLRVSFTDDAGHTESLTSEATEAVTLAVQAQQANTEATGAPTISGTAQVGQTLTAATSGIADADGLDDVSFSYQWLRHDGTDGSDISGATSSTYTLVDDDQGKTIKVSVSFTDDEGNDESLTSAATASVAARPNRAATGAPTISGTAQVGQTLTADTSGIADADGLTNVSWAYQWIANNGTSDTEITDATGSTFFVLAAYEDQTLKLRVSFTDDAGHWESLTSAATDAVTLTAQAQQSNSEATGAPTISGTAQVGQTLTADTSGIADADGLDAVSYSYQWIRDDAEITGATSSTYTLTDDDQGKTIKVGVSFTDDEGNDESLTSAATASVAARPNSAATGAPTISGTAQVGQTLTANTSGISDDDGLTEASYTYQWIRNDGVDDSDISGANSSTYELVDADQGKTVKVVVSFSDDAGNDESLTSAATAAVAARPNQAATGAPTISGTAQVGQTLTANTSGISDADGLADVSYTYQWVRNDGRDNSDISGASENTYTLTDDDEGKTVKVKVSFTDDAGHEESLTSASTGTVAAKPNSPATGAPTISGTAQVGQTLTANTSGISDDDGLTNVSYIYQWIRNDGTDDSNISGANGSTYELVDADQGKTIKVKVTFTDDAENDESLTSIATVAVAAPPLTADFLLVPSTHDGETVFSFRISFTEDLQNQSGRRIIAALSVSGGTVKSANRVNKARDLFVVKVTPSGTGDIAISLDAFTGACGDDDAICARDGRKLSNLNQATVSGPSE